MVQEVSAPHLFELNVEGPSVVKPCVDSNDANTSGRLNIMHPLELCKEIFVVLGHCCNETSSIPKITAIALKRSVSRVHIASTARKVSRALKVHRT